MVGADDQILELLEDDGRNLPANMSDILDFDRKYIGERCRVLAKEGLLNNVGNGLYEITDDGRRYLAGDLDARDLG